MKVKTRVFPVMSDYRATVEEMIEGGNLQTGAWHECFNSQIFPPKMPKERKERYLQYKEITLTSTNESIGTDGALELIEKMELRPADIFDLLTLNRTYPASPGIKKFYSLSGMSIIALGSLLPDKNKKMLQLAPVLFCRENKENPLDSLRRLIYLNQVEFYDTIKKKVKKSGDWWSKGTWFAATL